MITKRKISKLWETFHEENENYIRLNGQSVDSYWHNALMEEEERQGEIFSIVFLSCVVVLFIAYIAICYFY